MNLTKGWQVCRAAGQCCIVLARRADNAVMVFVVCEWFTFRYLSSRLQVMYLRILGVVNGSIK